MRARHTPGSSPTATPPNKSATRASRKVLPLRPIPTIDNSPGSTCFVLRLVVARTAILGSLYWLFSHSRFRFRKHAQQPSYLYRPSPPTSDCRGIQGTVSRIATQPPVACAARSLCMRRQRLVAHGSHPRLKGMRRNARRTRSTKATLISAPRVATAAPVAPSATVPTTRTTVRIAAIERAMRVANQC